MNPSHAYMVAGAINLIDIAGTDENGVVRGSYGGRTLEELKTEYGPDVQLLPFREAVDTCITNACATYCKPPVEITREHYWQMLKVLPPCKWTRDRGAECFYVSEALTGDLHSWCVCIGPSNAGRYFELTRSCRSTPAEIMAEVATSIGLRS